VTSKLWKTPVLARQVLAAISSVYSWAVNDAYVLEHNPCQGMRRAKARARERILSDHEIPLFWREFEKHGVVGRALQVLLLTGQRPGEVANMQREHIRNGWWEMPGESTKNSHDHKIWLPLAVQQLISNGDHALHLPGAVFTEKSHNLVKSMQVTMSTICKKLQVDRATPHDLRRTHGSTVTRLLGFGGTAAMNRIMNHRERGVTGTYDRNPYHEDIKRVMEMVSSHITALVEGKEAAANVISFST
jgi:integrase